MIKGSFSSRQDEILLIVNIIGSVLSFIGSLFIIFTFWRLENLRSKISFQFIFFISVGDCIRAFANLWGSPDSDTVTCYIQGFLHEFGGLSSFFWVGVIVWVMYAVTHYPKAWNTSTIKARTKTIHFIVWPTAFLLSFLPITTLSYENVGGWCWLSHDRAGQIWSFISFYIELWLILIFVIFLYWRLYRFISIIQPTHQPDHSIAEISSRFRKRSMEKRASKQIELGITVEEQEQKDLSAPPIGLRRASSHHSDYEDSGDSANAVGSVGTEDVDFAAAAELRTISEQKKVNPSPHKTNEKESSEPQLMPMPSVTPAPLENNKDNKQIQQFDLNPMVHQPSITPAPQDTEPETIEEPSPSNAANPASNAANPVSNSVNQSDIVATSTQVNESPNDTPANEAGVGVTTSKPAEIITNPSPSIPERQQTGSTPDGVTPYGTTSNATPPIGLFTANVNTNAATPPNPLPITVSEAISDDIGNATTHPHSSANAEGHKKIAAPRAGSAPTPPVAHKTSDSEVTQRRNRTVGRMFFFPLVLFVCFFFATVRRIWNFSGSDAPFFIVVLRVLFAASYGFGNACVYTWTVYHNLINALKKSEPKPAKDIENAPR